jgi:hypothetical protein
MFMHDGISREYFATTYFDAMVLYHLLFKVVKEDDHLILSKFDGTVLMAKSTEVKVPA